MVRPRPVASLGNWKLGSSSDTSAQMCVDQEDEGRKEWLMNYVLNQTKLGSKAALSPDLSMVGKYL